MNVLVEQLGWMLIHSLWQFAILAWLAGITVRLLGRRSAALRYGILVIAMAILVMAPVATWLRPYPVPSPISAASVTGPTAKSASIVTVSSVPKPPRVANDPNMLHDLPDGNTAMIPNSQSGDLPESESQSSDLRSMAATKHPGVLAWFERVKTGLRPWLAWIVAAWGLGVIVCALRPLLGWYTLRRLRRIGVSAVSEEVLTTLRRLSARLGLRRTVSVMYSTLAQAPVVVGYLKPIVLLPASLMTHIPAAQLEAILAHELAHVRRHDFIVNLLQTLIETLFFYHPAVWWLSSQIRMEREHCCDDLVVQLLGNRVEYGRALLAVAELPGGRTLLAPGATDGSLLSRIRRIVQGPPAQTYRPTWWGVSLILVLLITIGYSAASMTSRPVRPSNPYLVMLPDGSTVELLGITSDGTDPATWWLPNGEIRELDPLPKEKITSNPDWKTTDRRFAVRSTGVPGRVSWFFPNDGQYQSSGSVGQAPDWVQEHCVRPLGLSSQDSITVYCGLGDAEFGPWARVNRAGERLTLPALSSKLRPQYAAVIPLRVDSANGITRLFLQPERVDSYRVTAKREWVAVSNDGTRRSATSAYYNPSAPELHFDLSPDVIDHFEFRLQPYRHWVAFENVSLNAGLRTAVNVSLTSQQVLKDVEGEPRFTSELLLELSRESAHAGRWYFIDLDRGRMIQPPFGVEIDTQRFPYFVIQPKQTELNAWLVQEGVDLILWSQAKPLPDGSGRMNESVQIRSVRTTLGSFANGLRQRPDGSWTWKTLPSDVVAQFARRDDAIHMSGFVPNSVSVELRADSPHLQAFRTAENMLGLFLLEQPQPLKDRLTLRVVRVADSSAPLADIQFAAADPVSGKEGPANPSVDQKNPAEKKIQGNGKTSTLELRFAANLPESQLQPVVPADHSQRRYPDNTPEGRVAAKDKGFIWIKVANAQHAPVKLPIEGVRGDEFRIALVADTFEHMLIPDGKWSVEECRVVPNPVAKGDFSIRIKLNDAGGKLLRTLTKSHRNQALAIIVNGEILSAPVVREEIGSDFEITGNFSREQAEKLAAGILQGSGGA